MSLSAKHDPAILALHEEYLREFSQKTPEHMNRELYEVLEKECDEYETREAAMVLASLREAKENIGEAQTYYKKMRGIAE